jgi:hypothetical protein
MILLSFYNRNYTFVTDIAKRARIMYNVVSQGKKIPQFDVGATLISKLFCIQKSSLEE